MKNSKHILTFVLALVILCTSVQGYAVSLPKVAAKGAIAMDYKTGKILYQKDINTPRSIASMTKVMTALLVYDAIAEGRIDNLTKIPITAEARSIIPWDPCGVYVPYKNEETVYDLLSIYLIVSSSPAGTSLGQYLAGSVPEFVDMMNEKAKDLGIDAHYNDPNGLKPNEVTPLAQAKLTRHFIQKYPEVLDITKKKSIVFNGHTFNSTNKFYSNFSWYDAYVDGFKSGTMSFAGSCFSTTAKRGEDRVISVVINSSDMNERFRDSIKLLDYAFEQYPIYYNTSDWAKNIPIEAEYMGFNTALIQGKEEFEGMEPINRGEFTSMLVRALQLQEKESQAFIDVEEEKWYSKDVRTARAYGLVQGTGENYFKPEQLLSRQEMALMLQNCLKLEDKEEPQIFKDHSEIGEVYKEAVYRMKQYEIILGTDEGTFLPLGVANRESATSMMLNLVYGMLNGTIPQYDEQAKEKI